MIQVKFNGYTQHNKQTLEHILSVGRNTIIACESKCVKCPDRIVCKDIQRVLNYLRDIDKK